MIKWELKNIVLRFLDNFPKEPEAEKVDTIENNITPMVSNHPEWEWKKVSHGLLSFFIVAILPDDSEKLLYEFTFSSSLEDKELFRSTFFELTKNNAKALISYSDANTKLHIKEFAYVKMKNFKDVDIEIQEDVIPMPFGKFIGQNVKTLSKHYKSYVRKKMNDALDKYPAVKEIIWK